MELPRVCKLRLHAFAGSVTVNFVHDTPMGKGIISQSIILAVSGQQFGNEWPCGWQEGILIVDQFAQP